MGLSIDNKLKFDTHVENLCKKLSRAVFALFCLKQKVDKKTLKNCYFAYFQSLLAYGIEIWGHLYGYLFDRIFKLQKKAIRIIADVPTKTSCRNLFKELCILPLPALYATQVLIFLKKYPDYMEGYKLKHAYNTRQKNQFPPQYHHTIIPLWKGSVLLGTKVVYGCQRKYVKKAISKNSKV